MILAERRQLSQDIYNTSKQELRPRIRRHHNLKPFFVVMGVFLCLTLANLWIQVAIVKLNDEIKECRATIRLVERDSIKTRMEMANLDSFERIQSYAINKLHMRIAGPGDYRFIAAAPSLHRNEPRPYNYVAKTAPHSTHVWGKLASWFEGFRTAMAQSNDN
jgi:cell division protein FtsL